MVTQVGGREPEAEMLCAGHRAAILNFAKQLAPFVTIRTTV
jgi:hypothetical protein